MLGSQRTKVLRPSFVIFALVGCIVAAMGWFVFLAPPDVPEESATVSESTMDLSVFRTAAWTQLVLPRGYLIVPSAVFGRANPFAPAPLTPSSTQEHAPGLLYTAPLDIVPLTEAPAQTDAGNKTPTGL